MRFIQLKMFRNISHYDSIIQFGCGPNFVLNRADLFTKMIVNQGIQFWFRFWLSFCFSPCCYDLNVIRKQWPKMTTYISIAVHNQFLQYSPNEIATYCIERIIKPMLIISSTKSSIKGIQENLSFQELQDLVVKSWGLSFGCALCHIFFKWLIAEDMKYNSKSYWSVPKQYLNPDFKPGIFEKFLASRWRGELWTFLGLNELQAPWLMDLLNSDNIMNERFVLRDLKSTPIKSDLTHIQNTAEFMKEIRNGRKRAIQDVDEEPQKKRYNSDISRIPVYKGKSTSKLKSSTKCMARPILKKFASEISFRTNRQCHACQIFESNHRKFKKCKRCVDEKWSQPRYYCSVDCQTHHWYTIHHDEHSKQKN